MAVSDLDGNGTGDIVVSSTTLAVPIRVFHMNGTLLNTWSTLYPEREGVNVAAGDLDGDGRGEVVVAPRSAVAPELRIFSVQGTIIGRFPAFPSAFRGGVNVAVGDVNSDGLDEIVVSPASAGGPQVRIFDNHARLLGQLFVFDQRLRGGMTISILR